MATRPSASAASDYNPRARLGCSLQLDLAAFIAILVL